MTRKTEVPEEGHDFYRLTSTQEQLDVFWSLIEDSYEEEWRVEISGAISLVVDSALLERVLKDNIAIAWFKFGSNMGGVDAEGNKSFTNRPVHLKGLYSIEGVYNAKQAYVGGARTYHFEKE